MKRLSNPLLAASLLLLASACQKVERIEVKPEKVALSTAGQSVSLEPQALTAKGEPVDNEKAKFTFASSDGQVATVDPAGKVTAVKSGSATITTTSGEVKATTPVEISIPARIEVAGAPVTLTGLGSRADLGAEVKDDAGRPVPTAKLEFASADATIVAVEGTRLTAQKVGTTSVLVTSGGLKQTVEVTVALPEVASVSFDTTPPPLKVGESAPLVAVAKTAEGTSIQGAVFTFTSSNDKVATVDATGAVQGVKPGTATLKAESGGKSAELELTIKKK